MEGFKEEHMLCDGVGLRRYGGIDKARLCSSEEDLVEVLTGAIQGEQS